MFKKIRNEPLAVLVLVLLLGFAVLAAKPAGMTGLTSLWVGDQTQTADVTPGANDVYVYGTFEADGAARFDGAVDMNGALDVAGAFTNANTKSFVIPITAVYVNGVGVVSATSSPSLLAVAPGGTPALVYGASTVTTSFGHSFIAPTDYSGAMAFRMFHKTLLAATSPTSFAMDWELWVNKSNTLIDAAPFKQSRVNGGSTEFQTSNQVMTFTVNTIAIAGIAAGDLVTVYWSPYDTRAVPSALYDFEITGLEGRYE